MITELECRLADVSVQLERALSKNATLEGQNQLLETFFGLQSKVNCVARAVLANAQSLIARGPCRV